MKNSVSFNWNDSETLLSAVSPPGRCQKECSPFCSAQYFCFCLRYSASLETLTFKQQGACDMPYIQNWRRAPPNFEASVLNLEFCKKRRSFCRCMFAVVVQTLFNMLLKIWGVARRKRNHISITFWELKGNYEYFSQKFRTTVNFLGPSRLR